MNGILQRALALFALSGSMLAGCAPSTPTPTVQPTLPVVIPTTTTAPTSTPLATSTPLPTSSPTIAPSPTWTPSPTLAATGTPTSTASTECKPTARFISDVTVPDNTRFDQGTAFTKTWRVKNSGTCDWPADTALVFVTGRKLDADPTTLPVGAVKAGDTKDISVNMKARMRMRPTWSDGGNCRAVAKHLRASLTCRS